MWTCPHCGAAQAAASRCWVCHRSSTTCSTCRHFRTSLAAAVGWCALDRRRRPLTGLELRGCWTERPSAGAAATSGGARGPSTPSDTWRDRPVRDFVPVDAAVPRTIRTEPEPPTPVDLALPVVDPPEAWDGRVSLFGDAER